ncbi:MAG: 23S rRNA (adenine(2503)-C(2))-methyltransferase RlmN [Bacillota bacterium]|nr:23S rRNA (adenine(2503)-C(2))-methyltransferase RlmN [Bacillota bacterium]
MSKTDLRGLSREQVRSLVLDLGEPAFRGDQVFEWVFAKRVSGFDRMSNVPKSFASHVERVAEIGRLEIQSERKSSEGTTKYLFALRDGQAVESVLIPHRYGMSVCVSSQAGCRMACRFCASAEGGFVRNLTASEITSQVLEIQALLDVHDVRVSRVDFMGTGEPLDNYENVLQAMKVLSDPGGLGIGARKITVSTCGIVPGILRLAGEGMQVTLSVSLHAPDNALRDMIMPVNKRYPLEELLPACDEYAKRTGRRVTYEYVLLLGFNDTAEHARKLSRLLRGRLAHVNLIPLNPVAGGGFERSSQQAVTAFSRELGKAGVAQTVRREMGARVDAACGQLRRRHVDAGRRQVGKRPDQGTEPG